MSKNYTIADYQNEYKKAVKNNDADRMQWANSGANSIRDKTGETKQYATNHISNVRKANPIVSKPVISNSVTTPVNSNVTLSGSRDDRYYNSNSTSNNNTNSYRSSSGNDINVQARDSRVTSHHLSDTEPYDANKYSLPNLGMANVRGDKNIFNTDGELWQDTGYNNGSVKMMNEQGRLVSVNAKYAHDRLKKGYTLRNDSQSIERALQSEVFNVQDRADSAIRGGTYDRNNSYINEGSYVPGSGYKTDYAKSEAINRRAGMGSIAPVGNQQMEQLNLQQGFNQEQMQGQFDMQEQQYSPSSNSVEIPNVGVAEKTSSGSYVIQQFDGSQAELSEDDYTNMLLEMNGFAPQEKKTP